MNAEQLAKAGVGEDMIRLSVGLENSADITADLGQALRSRRRVERWTFHSRPERPRVDRRRCLRCDETRHRIPAWRRHGSTVWFLQSCWFAFRGRSVLALDFQGMAARTDRRFRPSTRWRTGQPPCSITSA